MKKILALLLFFIAANLQAQNHFIAISKTANANLLKFERKRLEFTEDRKSALFKNFASAAQNDSAATTVNKKVIVFTPIVSLLRVPNTDLSFIISGKEGDDILKSDVSASFEKPEAEIQVTIPLSKSKFDYSAGNFGGESIGSLIKRSRWAMQIEFKGGVDNSIVGIFDNNKLNPQASLKVGFSCILPGLYKMELASVEELKLKLDNASEKVAGSILLNSDLLQLYNKRIKEIERKQGEVDGSSAEGVLLEIEKNELKRKVAAEEDESDGHDLDSETEAAQNKVFDGYAKGSRLFQWLTFAPEIGYQDHLRYSTNVEAAGKILDTCRQIVGGVALSYNLYYAAASNRSGTKVYFGLRAKFGSYNNTASADVLSVVGSDSTLATQNGIEITQAGVSGDAYHRADLEKKFSFTLASDLIWWLDKSKIFGLNIYSSITLRDKQAIITPGVGLSFAIPKKGDGGSKSLVNFIPFIEFKDVTRSKDPNNYNRQTKDYVSLGIKGEVPFSIFGK